MSFSRRGAKKKQNNGGGCDAGSDADGSFVSCVSEPTSPTPLTWPSHEVTLLRSFDQRPKGNDNDEGEEAHFGSVPASKHSIITSPRLTHLRLPENHLQSPAIFVPEIQNQPSSLPLVDFLSRFKPIPSHSTPPPQSAMRGFSQWAQPRRRKQTMQSSSSSSSLVASTSPPLLSLQRLRNDGGREMEKGDCDEGNDDGEEEEDYETEGQDATPSTPLILKRKLNEPIQSKHSYGGGDSPSFPSPPLPPSVLNRIDEVADTKIVEQNVGKLSRWRIRDMVPFPWKRRRRKLKNNKKFHEADYSLSASDRLSSSSSRSWSPPPMMITITEDGKAIIQKPNTTTSSLRMRPANGIGRWEGISGLSDCGT